MTARLADALDETEREPPLPTRGPSRRRAERTCISTHVVPGRNLTWFVVFLTALAGYFVVLVRLTSSERHDGAGTSRSPQQPVRR